MTTPADQHKGWSQPKPGRIPPPTYWPLVLAAGVVGIAWGLVFSPWFVGLGAVLVIMSLAGWVWQLHQDVRQAPQNGNETEGVKNDE